MTQITSDTLTLAEKYARFAVGTRLASVPDEVVQRVKIHLLDTLGVALTGSSTPIGTKVCAVLSGIGGHPEATVLGSEARLPIPSAAFVNGTYAHSIEFDDLHKPSVMHPSASIVPAALAAAEYSGASGQQLLEALVAGYEITLRLGNAQVDDQTGQSVMFENGIHTTSVVGAVGSAAVAARLLGLTTEGTAHAVAISCSFGSGIVESNRAGGQIKGAHCGWAAHAGVMAALLAREGVTGPASAIEGRFGLFQAFTHGRWNPAAANHDLGSRWESLRLAVKPYPCNGFTHPVIDAALELRRRGIRAKDLTAVEIGISEQTLGIIGEPIDQKRRPPTGYGAKFSAPYVFATAMLSPGDSPGVGMADFDDSAILDDEKLNLTSICSVVKDASCTQAFPQRSSCVVHATTRDGNAHFVHIPQSRGYPGNQFTWDDICDKVLRLQPQRGPGLIDAVRKVADLDTVADLVR